jgi:hypothetical protein
MLPRVLTPGETANVLRVSEADVETLVRLRKLRGFSVLGQSRITEQALAEFIDAGEPPTPADERAVERPESAPSPVPRHRNRNLNAENRARQWAIDRLRRAAPDLDPAAPRKAFTANGKRGILAVATTPSGSRRDYWFGFPGRLLDADAPTVLVAVIAGEPPVAFVVPCRPYRDFLAGLSSDGHGGLKFRIALSDGRAQMTGSSGAPPIDVAPYRDAFGQFAVEPHSR